MKLSLQLLAVVILSVVGRGAAGGLEFWKFQFAPNGSLPYFWSGEGPSARADVAGSFTLGLDWERLTGQLWELDDQLVNIHDVNYPTGELQPTEREWIDPQIQPWYIENSFLEGPFTYENGMWKVAFPGQSIGGILYLPYTITFNTNQAWFNLTVPIYDDWGQVINAPATFDIATLAGDYNGNYVVDAADYVAWRKMDGSQNGREFWQQNFGVGTSAAATNTTVPEPATTLSLLAGTGLFFMFKGMAWQEKR